MASSFPLVPCGGCHLSQADLGLDLCSAMCRSVWSSHLSRGHHDRSSPAGGDDRLALHSVRRRRADPWIPWIKSDLSSYAIEERPGELWAFDQERLEELRSLTAGTPSLRGVISRAFPRYGYCLLYATCDELKELKGLLEGALRRARSPKRSSMLLVMLQALSSSINGSSDPAEHRLPPTMVEPQRQ